VCKVVDEVCCAQNTVERKDLDYLRHQFAKLAMV
jgi:hypothetical protein